MDVHADLLAILQADAELGAILTGGIYGDALDPDDPVTGQAWQAHPVTQVKRLRPAGVLLPPQEVDRPLALNPTLRASARLDVDLWPELYLYAERGDVPATFGPADERAMELLHGLRLGTADISATGFRARPLQADELPGDIWTTFRRYRVQAVRHITKG